MFYIFGIFDKKANAYTRFFIDKTTAEIYRGIMSEIMNNPQSTFALTPDDFRLDTLGRIYENDFDSSYEVGAVECADTKDEEQNFEVSSVVAEIRRRAVEAKKAQEEFKQETEK